MKDTVTVLVVTGVMNAGGAETLIMELLRYKGPEIKYVMLVHHDGIKKEGIYDKEIISMGIPVISIPSVGSLGVRKYIEIFCEKVRYIGPIDILHSHLNGVGGIIAKAAKKAGIKNTIIHCHADITFTGSLPKRIKNELELLLFKIYVNKYADYCWACSENAGKRLFFKNKQVTIIPNIINVPSYLMTDEKRRLAKNKFGLENKFVLGSVGRIARIKNYEFVIRLLTYLKKMGTIVDFICFGRVTDQQYFNELNQLAQELEVKNQIHFMGNSKEIFCDIGCIDVFLMPSHSEGFGLAAVEAQAAGILTLVSLGVPKLIDVGLGIIKFLSLDSLEPWANAIVNKPNNIALSHDIILQKFNQIGFNAETMVRKIEKKYIQIKLNE